MLHCLLYLHVKNVAARQRFLHSARLLTSLTSSLASPMNSKRGTRVKLQDFLQEHSSGHKLYSFRRSLLQLRIFVRLFLQQSVSDQTCKICPLCRSSRSKSLQWRLLARCCQLWQNPRGRNTVADRPFH